MWLLVASPGGLGDRIDQSLKPHPRPLPRSLGMFAVLFLTLSVTTPASSVFVIIPGMLQAAGSGALWAMLIAAVVLIATAYIYAELSSAWPIAGGEYVMIARTMGPAAGFAILGVSVVNNVLFPPVAGLGISAVLSTIVPGLPQVPVAIGVVTAATLCGLLNIRVNAWITGIFLYRRRRSSRGTSGARRGGPARCGPGPRAASRRRTRDRPRPPG